MRTSTSAALSLLFSAALLAAGCDTRGADAPSEADGVVPEGTSVEPAAPPAATGGVTFPGEADADTVPGTAPGGATGTPP